MVSITLEKDCEWRSLTTTVEAVAEAVDEDEEI